METKDVRYDPFASGMEVLVHCVPAGYNFLVLVPDRMVEPAGNARFVARGAIVGTTRRGWTGSTGSGAPSTDDVAAAT
jgi:hypothetical protein